LGCIPNRKNPAQPALVLGGWTLRRRQRFHSADFFTLYLLAIGAGKEQIGLLNSLTNLSAALFLLPGALMVERFGRRKELTVIFGGGIARFLLLVLALLPLGWAGKGLIWTVIAVTVLRSIAGNLAFPAWMSFTADVVPI